MHTLGKRSQYHLQRATLGLLIGLSAIAGLLRPALAVADPLVIYSARNEQLIQPIFDAYTRETGIEIRYTTAEAGVLIQRLQAEGARSPADILLTVDAGELWNASEKGLLRALESPVLQRNIPAYLRDPQNRWFGLSMRARAIFYHPDRVDVRRLKDYSGLADPQWAGRLCLRTSKKVYNQSLIATLISRNGEARTERDVRGWISNLAAPVFANDTQVIEAIAAGQCDVGIANTYYFGRLQRDRKDIPVRIFWPAAETGGTHVNISGAGIVSTSRQPAAAQRFLEWLSAGAAQQKFASLNFEYPVNPAVTVDPLVEAWGDFAPSPINLLEAGRLQPAAVRLMDRAGYR
jgi:iron(III) transport system substrate-binding protein